MGRPERSPRLPPGSTWWLIARNGNNRIEVLTVERGGKEALAIFSFEEEAKMYLWFGALSAGWRVRECGTRELVSVLCGLSAGVDNVTLDPLPGILAEKTPGLVNLDHARIAGRLVGGSGSQNH